MYLIIESIMVWVAKELKDHLVATHLPWAGMLSTRSDQTKSLMFITDEHL